MKILGSYIMLGYKKVIDKFETDLEADSEEVKLLKLLQALALKEIKPYKAMAMKSSEKVDKLVMENWLT